MICEDLQMADEFLKKITLAILKSQNYTANGLNPQLFTAQLATFISHTIVFLENCFERNSLAIFKYFIKTISRTTVFYTLNNVVSTPELQCILCMAARYITTFYEHSSHLST
ncbi:hypothetical protein L798_04405 [Zootermopsis nevadensis]|uniref:Uncharacterized protein n=1 Tax=Zootermopsis nevadensis TaxID=136037 RepID=A0A067RA59_ZOONE|nr:hypothetical protein L798_04405 [Zootermopsis nevadensis]